MFGNSIYFQLLNWHKIVICSIMLTFFLENLNISNWLLLSVCCHMLHHSHHLTKYEGKGTKISIFKLFSELGKIWKCNLGFSKNSNFPSLLTGYQILNLWMNWEKLCPKFSFTVENKMENSHKKRWSHFKLYIGDWDIPLPEILRIYQWIRKNIFY